MKQVYGMSNSCVDLVWSVKWFDIIVSLEMFEQTALSEALHSQMSTYYAHMAMAYGKVLMGMNFNGLWFIYKHHKTWNLATYRLEDSPALGVA